MSRFGFTRKWSARALICLSSGMLTFAAAGCADEEDEGATDEKSSLAEATRPQDEAPPTRTERGASDGTGTENPGDVETDVDADADEGVEEGAASGSERELEPRVIALSAEGHDRLYGLAVDEAGNIYATGQIADGVEMTADFSLLVAKFTPDGELDTEFGRRGVATHNVTEGGGSREVARGIVVQSNGKIVIAGAAEHDPSAEGLAANDTDIVLVRFEADGTLDTSFGDEGQVVIDLNSGVEGVDGSGVAAWVAGDSQWGLALSEDDGLVVHGAARAEGMQDDGTTPREDADWVLLRLTADGEFDRSFGDEGKVTLDIGQAGASARGITVLEDGSIVASGYLNSSVLGEESQQPVLYKVTADGEFDRSFATDDAWEADGVWHDYAVMPPLRAEAYGVALQGDKFVTIGYGPTPDGGTTTDWVLFRFTASGERDTSWGTEGTTYIDAQGYGDNGRFALALPDNRIVGCGGGRPKPAVEPEMGMQPPADAMVAILTEDGVPDESFGKGGFQTFDLGGNDFFWAGALAPDASQVAIAGIAGGATMGVDDDDSALLLLPLK
jgi:uncharacterized delta-60 repeat protein